MGAGTPGTVWSTTTTLPSLVYHPGLCATMRSTRIGMKTLTWLGSRTNSETGDQAWLYRPIMAQRVPEQELPTGLLPLFPRVEELVGQSYCSSRGWGGGRAELPRLEEEEGGRAELPRLEEERVHWAALPAQEQESTLGSVTRTGAGGVLWAG